MIKNRSILSKPPKIAAGTKLIIEHDKQGIVFFYSETPSHFKKTEPVRSSTLTKRTLCDLKTNCLIGRGSYLVVDLAAEI